LPVSHSELPYLVSRTHGCRPAASLAAGRVRVYAGVDPITGSGIASADRSRAAARRLKEETRLKAQVMEGRHRGDASQGTHRHGQVHLDWREDNGKHRTRTSRPPATPLTSSVFSQLTGPFSGQVTPPRQPHPHPLRWIQAATTSRCPPWCSLVHASLLADRVAASAGGWPRKYAATA